jgi:hypothetical protein
MYQVTKKFIHSTLLASLLLTASPMLMPQKATLLAAQNIDQLRRLASSLKEIDLVVQAEKNIHDKILAYINTNGTFGPIQTTLGANGVITNDTLILLGLPTNVSQYKQSVFSTLPLSVIVDSNTIVVNNGFSYKAASEIGEQQASYYIKQKGIDTPSFTDNEGINVSTWEVLIPSTTQKIMELKTQADEGNFSFGPNEPVDKTKPWIKTNPDGTYEVMIWDAINNKWVSKGTETNTGDTLLTYFASDGFDAATTPGQQGWQAKVEEEGSFVYYTHNGTEWIPEASGTSGGLFNGTGTVLAMATTKFTAAGGSIMDSPAPNGEWGGSSKFTKKEDATSGGYWTTENNQFMVTNTIDSLSSFSPLFLTSTTAWIKKDASSIYKLKKLAVPTKGTFWVYISPNYASLQEFETSPMKNNDGKYIYVESDDAYVYYENNHFKAVNKTTFVTFNDQGRNVFTPQSGKTYLVQTNDCTTTTCNGTSSPYYAGTKIENLYAFYHSTSGNRKNSLIDATPYTNWNSFWTAGPNAVLWNGSTFGDVPSGTILIKSSINSSISYKKASNNQQVNKANGYNIPYNVLPSGFFASTVSLGKHGGSRVYVNVVSLDQFVLETHLPVSYMVYITGSGFSNMPMVRINNYSDDLVWANHDNISYASVAVTNGSRTDLPPPSNASRLNLTKQVGTEARNTPSGLTYASDTGWKQWFFGTAGTRTNNMLDAIATTNAYIDTTAISVGYAVQSGTVLQKCSTNYWCRIGTSTVVDKNLNNRSTSTVFPIGTTGNYDGYYADNTTNAYTDATAISVGYAIQGSTYLQKSGNYWKELGTSNYKDSSLVTRATANIVPIGTASSSWKAGSCSSGITSASATTGQYKPSSSFAATNCNYNAATGLYFDNGSSARAWSSANSLCLSKGMRLPSLSETTAQRSGGIPLFTGDTWTSTVNGSGYHYFWSGTYINGYGDYYDFYVRCVVSP